VVKRIAVTSEIGPPEIVGRDNYDVGRRQWKCGGKVGSGGEERVSGVGCQGLM
jgi:hypothetical protein